MLTVFAQAAAQNNGLSIIDAAVQFGMAGAVIIVCGMFVWFIDRRDREQNENQKAHTLAMEKMTTEITKFGVVVSTLDTHVRESRNANRGRAS